MSGEPNNKYKNGKINRKSSKPFSTRRTRLENPYKYFEITLQDIKKNQQHPIDLLNVPSELKENNTSRANHSMRIKYSN